MRRLGLAFSVALLTACGPAEHEDLVQFVQETGKELRGKVDPLPEVKPYPPFDYEAFDLSDPFKPRKLSAGKGGAAQPDLNRPREPLENFPTENLKFVGTLMRDNDTYALIRTPDNVLYRVKKGNYLGPNFGLIRNVSETSVTLREIVLDTAGDWTERVTQMNLQE
jgi:type IV pilus assembly protein PilP